MFRRNQNTKADTSQETTAVSGAQDSTVQTQPEADIADSIGRLCAADRTLARLLQEKGFATKSELDSCAKTLVQRRITDEGALAEELVHQGFVTRTQLTRVRAGMTDTATGVAFDGDIPGYEVLERVAKGSAGTVYKAVQKTLDRVVAVKVIPRSAGDHIEIERLRREALASAQLNHPNIVQAIDVGQTDTCHYFVMEFVPGFTVHQFIEMHGRFECPNSLDIGISMADALAHAHHKGLVHRDVKPKNIILTDAGIAKLADLGLVRALADRAAALREKGKAMGTPYFISPEQARGDEHIGPGSDIYSLGATLYYMLTGRVPFEGAGWKEVLEKHVAEKVVPPVERNPGIEPGLSDVVVKMMAKRAEDRYPNCEELLVDLRAWKAFYVLQSGEKRSATSRKR